MFILVVAKEPVPGRVKTRLCPPCTRAQAATIAEAALADTFHAAQGAGADRVIVALDGEPGPWLPAGTTVIPQAEGSFEHRLARAWAEATTVADGPGIQIGMDTPQLTSADLDDAMNRLTQPGTDAVLGPATDGGWWLIGFHPTVEPTRVFAGIPMSTAETGRAQRRRMSELAQRVHLLATMTDVDEFDDARLLARAAPTTRFAAEVNAVEQVVART
ncbi:MAG: DUF2064 domain-containing protein [Acidimicrobiales bacterium]|nr:DUF2064 domain-containing protein [Acidimicrobiales bacterium]